MDNTQFFVFKLKTGETIFAELTSLSEKSITIRKPLLITENMVSTEGSLLAQQWLPYIEDDSNVPVPLSMIYLFEPLAQKYIRFYGSVLMQSEITRIKEAAVADSEEDDKIDYYDMMEAVQKINELSEYMSAKFGIDRVDTSGFMDAAENNKPVVH